MEDICRAEWVARTFTKLVIAKTSNPEYENALNDNSLKCSLKAANAMADLLEDERLCPWPLPPEKV